MENVIKRLVLLSTEKVVGPDQVKALLEFEDPAAPGPGDGDLEAQGTLPAGGDIVSMDEMEKAYLERALEHFDFNISSTAKALKISRKTIHNKLKRYGIVIHKTTVV